MSLRSKKAKAWTPPKPTPLSAMSSTIKRCIVTGATVAPPQPKEPPRRDPARVAWLRRAVTRCQICGATEALTVSHIDPPGHGVMGRKAHDDQTIRACWTCHLTEWHGQGRYQGRTRAESEALNADIIRENNLAYAGEQ